MAVKYSTDIGGFISVAEGFTFEVSGELTLPIETELGGRKRDRHILIIGKATAIFRVAGSSEYTVKVISVSSTGDDAVTHVNDTIAPTAGAQIDLDISSATIAAGRSVYITLQQLSGTPASDFTLILE